MDASIDPVAVARALAPRVAARADDVEAARRLPADLAAEIAEAGLFRLCVPRSLGGLECAPATIVETLETMGAADGSVGWCVMIGATTGLTGAYMAPEAAAEVYGDPLTITGGVFAPMGRAVAEGDGWRVTGRWQWGSGSQNCRWLMGGCVVEEGGAVRLLPNGAPEPVMMVMRAEDLVLHDTWHVAGLAGTGSLDMEARGVFVPHGRAVSLLAGRPHEPGPLYAFPVFGLLALGIASVALGIGRGALDDFRALAGTKKPGGGARTLAERPQVQAALAEAEGRRRGARAYLMETVAAAEAAARAGRIPMEVRADLRLACAQAVDASAALVDVAYRMGGGNVVYRTSPLQRRFRDIHVATQHIMVAPQTYELAGRALLGLRLDPSMI